MELFRKTNIDFLGIRVYFFILSLAVISISVFSLFYKGVNVGLDFSGGTLVQVEFKDPLSLSELRRSLGDSEFSGAELQSLGPNAFIVRVKQTADTTEETAKSIGASLQSALPQNPSSIVRREYVGPAVGEHLFKQALWALGLSLLAIIVYVGFRFTNMLWGVAGVIALFHDVFGTLGLFSVTGKEVDLNIVAALLTIAGYSINDTIVVFDRMRENMRILRREPLGHIINVSINETLSRTIITNMTVIGVVLVLYLFGGAVLRNFAMAMLFGMTIGTYSSIAVAAPIVYEWHKKRGDSV